MKKYIILFIVFLTALASHAEYMVVDVDGAGVRLESAYTGRFVGRLKRGTEVEVTETHGGWAKIKYKGEDRYIEYVYLSPSPREIEAGNVIPWRIPGPNQTTANDFGCYFSTDRIMETLPPLDFLYGKLPFDTDWCFKIAVWLLLGSWIGLMLIRSRIRYGNVWFWLTYGVAITISVCELLYVTGSGDPLGYCDINNVGFWTALWRVGLSGLALYQQLALFSTVMFVTQRDKEFNFGASWALKLMMLVVLYFIACVFARHFFYETFPPYVSYIALGLLGIPVIVMFIRGIITKDTVTFAVMLPFYVIVCAATLCIYCLIGVAVAVLTVLMLMFMLLTHSDSYNVKYNGIWYYCDYDTWREGMNLGLWDSWEMR